MFIKILKVISDFQTIDVSVVAIVLAGLVVLFVAAEILGYHYRILFDKFYMVFHFAGGALTYLLFLNLTQSRFLSLGLVAAVGIAWEVYEWALWKFFLKKREFKPGGKDTASDLLMDTLGALALFIIETFFGRLP